MASPILFSSSSFSVKTFELNDASRRAKNKFNITRFPMTNVNRKNGIHGHPEHSRHIHNDSIHSPHKTRKTILEKVIVFFFLYRINTYMNA